MRLLATSGKPGHNNFSKTEVVMNTFNGYMRSMRRFAFAFMAMTAFVLGPALSSANAAQKSFSSPEEAADALLAAASSGNRSELLKLFGPRGEKIIFSGDKVADKNMLEGFVAEFNQSHKIVSQDDASTMLYLGKDEWPFLIPIVKQGAVWKFDTKAGEQNLLDVRIGRNELSAIKAALAYVDAQREYYLADSNSDRLLEYATKFRSSPGKKDGLYWPAKAGEPESPLGPLFAKAQAEGYGANKGKPAPFHGYYYKILKAQGKDAPGGAFDYMAKGHMIGGFALIAYPARYGVSGVKSFIVNHDGVVYEMDLGRDTVRIASKMTRFNPDSNAVAVDISTVEPLPPLMEPEQ
jgi:hypothetical protein